MSATSTMPAIRLVFGAVSQLLTVETDPTSSTRRATLPTITAPIAPKMYSAGGRLSLVYAADTPYAW